MLDIKLCTDGDYEGDIELTDDGDIQLENGFLQNARVSILWIAGEWRLGPDIGLPWFEEILVKNPDTELIRREILNSLLNIDGVEDADVDILEFNSRDRIIKFKYIITANGEVYSEEMTLSG